jgi:hypothetical protein
MQSSAGFGICTSRESYARLGSVCAIAATSLRRLTSTFGWRAFKWETSCAGGIAMAQG